MSETARQKQQQRQSKANQISESIKSCENLANELGIDYSTLIKGNRKWLKTWRGLELKLTMLLINKRNKDNDKY